MPMNAPRPRRAPTPARRSCWRAQHGFTLIEVLVAMVVISLGLLGLAGLQVASLNNNQIAYHRSIASQQADDMADRIRANIDAVRAGNFDNPTATSDPGCLDSDCSVSEMAESNFVQWNANIGLLLPDGIGTVQCAVGPAANCTTNTAGVNRVFDIRVSWTEKTAGGNQTQSFTTRFMP
jgi:type IV pilus assembly protein PilV